VFLGRNAGNFTITGSGNTASGVSALQLNTTGDENTATGALALSNNTMGGNNTATGVGTLQNNIDGTGNTATGRYALKNNITGGSNTATGANALLDTIGAGNTGMGVNVLLSNTSGADNTAIGGSALSSNTMGSGNIAVGTSAGFSTTGDNNIDIGNAGVGGESATIRIGSASQTRAFLAGVRGVTTGAANGLAVLIDSNGQLGTISSSASVKRQIADVGEASSQLLKLRPVSFFYRNDTEGIRQYGLIAEEVAAVMPDLVEFSAAGKADTVRYHFLTPLLLNELQKQHRRNEEQESRIEQLLARLDALEAGVTVCEAPTN
jgi:hypothetical protein